MSTPEGRTDGGTSGRTDGNGAAMMPSIVTTAPTVVAENAEPAGGSNSDAVDSAALSGHAARGVGVTMAGQLTRILLQAASVAVLARLLDPHDYGLLAMTLTVVGFAEIFRDFGLSSAAIQARALSSAQRNTLFWLNTAAGAGLAVIVAAGAPLVAAAFDQPELTGLTRVLALIFVVNGLGTQYRADLTRKLRFGRIVSADVAGQALGMAVGIAAAVAGAGYWALAAQQLSQLAVTLALFVVFAGWLPRRPRLHTGVGPMVRLGGHFAVTQVLYYVANNVDTLTVALRFGSIPLGLYNRAYALLTSPLNSLRAPVSTVAVPILAKLRDDPRRSAALLVRGQIGLGYTIVAALAFAAGAADPIVALLMGPTWSRIAPVLMFLAVACVSSTLAYVAFWVYSSRGLGRELARFSFATLVLQAACIVAGSWWGIRGVAAGYALAAVLEWPLSLWWLSRVTPIPVQQLFRGAARITCCAVWCGVCVRVVCVALASLPAALTLVCAAATAVVAYVVAAALSARVRDDVSDVRRMGLRMLRR